MATLRSSPAGWCTVAAAAWLCAGALLLWLCTGEVSVFFYQPRAIAVLHCLTLGWISSLLLGAVWVEAATLVPALELRRGRVRLQIFLFHFGASGLVAHFWIGRLNGMAWSAATLLLSVWLLAAVVVPILGRHAGRQPVAFALLAATACLLLTATVGTLLAVDKLEGFLPGSSLRNLSAHAHLGMLGWMGLGAAAVGYGLLPANATVRRVPWTAQLVLQAAAVCVLSWLIAAGSPALGMAAVVLVAACCWHVWIVWRSFGRPEAWIDLTRAHLLAGHACLVGAFVCGAFLLWRVNVGSDPGTRLAEFYSVLLLLGWMSNVLFAGLRRLPAAPGALIPVLRTGRVEFVLLNLAVLDLVASTIGGSPAGFRVSAALLGLLGAVVLTRAWREGRVPVS